MNTQNNQQNGKGKNPHHPEFFLCTGDHPDKKKRGKHPNPKSRALSGSVCREVIRRKASRPPKLLTLPAWALEEMLTRIRMGTFDKHAAGCVGIMPQTFSNWIREGARAYTLWCETGELEDDTDCAYAGFFFLVIKARYEGFSSAEITLFQKDPKGWLQSGPAREMWGNREPSAHQLNIINQVGVQQHLGAQIESHVPDPTDDEEYESTCPTPASVASGANALLEMGYTLQKQSDGTTRFTPPSLPEDTVEGNGDDRGNVNKMLTLDIKPNKQKGN